MTLRCQHGHPIGRRHLHDAAVGLALLAALVVASPAQARAKNCSFQSNGQLQLAFGKLLPSQGAPVQQRATAARPEDLSAGDCVASARMRIQVDGGANDAGGRLRMKHSASAHYLRYTVQVSPSSLAGPGNKRYVTFELQGAIDAADLANAPSGLYQDQLRISVIP